MRPNPRRQGGPAYGLGGGSVRLGVRGRRPGAAAAGAVNALAGRGTLISFPVMTALGVPAVEANATNTVALCPG